ncbi:MAG: sensor domain-containing diguanylate cyclase [Alphaproteobacteria bacterium]|nr:sensor domain-containing diguanylate cyclase [Alphaproteobacteria bacterium]
MPEGDPPHERARLDALHRYDVLDTPAEESFDRITRLAQLVVQAPIVLVSLIDRDRQWCKSRRGPGAGDGPREMSFCTHAIGHDVPTIVADALEDPRFRGHPAVTGAPHIRFYLGVPLRTPDGFNIGTLCALDRQPREVSQTHVAAMQDLARLVVDELELRRMASTDSLTGAMTRRAFVAEVAKELERARRYGHQLACIVLDIDRFGSVNDRFGHAAGDRVLQALVTTCRRQMRAVDLLARVGGGEFAIALPQTSLAAAAIVAERLRAALHATTIAGAPDPISVTASFGAAVATADDVDFASVLARADRAADEARRRGRDGVVAVARDGIPGQG